MQALRLGNWGVDLPLILFDGEEGDATTPIAGYIEGRFGQLEVLVVLARLATTPAGH